MASKKKKGPTPPPPPISRKPAAVAGEPGGPSRKEQARAARRKQEQRARLRRILGALGLVAAVLAAVAAYVVYDRRSDAQLREELTAGSCEVDRETDPTRPAGQNHVPSARYAVNPPAGGDHLASVASSGVYSGAAVPQDGQLVHSLEHGYVIAWHRPDLPAEQKEQLEAFHAEHDGDVIVVERAQLPVPFAATAWGHRLLCQSVEPEPLERFFAEHVGNGPEKVDRG
jgi:hypothetical protein